VISLPGLLSYFAPEDLRPLLEVARDKNVRIEALNRVDVDSIARQVWSSLNTVRGMGFDLGKYSLLPLTLEQCDTVVAQIERDFSDWSAAPVCYVDQGIVASDHLYLEGGELVEGVKRWLRMIATHRVRLALIDTVDKAGGWKLVKVNDDPKGLLTMQQIASLNALGNQLNIRIMWAGGLEAEQVYALGRIGVFGLYVTTAVCDPMPVAGESYVRDPALSALKKPNPEKILKAKILLEAGFFASGATGIPRELAQAIDRAGMDVVRLRSLLQEAWSALAAA
jgi:hypothetical protein